MAQVGCRRSKLRNAAIIIEAMGNWKRIVIIYWLFCGSHFYFASFLNPVISIGAILLTFFSMIFLLLCGMRLPNLGDQSVIFKVVTPYGVCGLISYLILYPDAL